MTKPGQPPSSFGFEPSAFLGGSLVGHSSFVIPRRGAMPPVRIEVGRREAGQTVAAVLKARLHLSWSQAKRLVERHHVRYAGQLIGDPAHRVKAGKAITVAA